MHGYAPPFPALRRDARIVRAAPRSPFRHAKHRPGSGGRFLSPTSFPGTLPSHGARRPQSPSMHWPYATCWAMSQP